MGSETTTTRFGIAAPIDFPSKFSSQLPTWGEMKRHFQAWRLESADGTIVDGTEVYSAIIVDTDVIEMEPVRVNRTLLSYMGSGDFSETLAGADLLEVVASRLALVLRLPEVVTQPGRTQMSQLRHRLVFYDSASSTRFVIDVKPQHLEPLEVELYAPTPDNISSEVGALCPTTADRVLSTPLPSTDGDAAVPLASFARAAVASLQSNRSTSVTFPVTVGFPIDASVNADMYAFVIVFPICASAEVVVPRGGTSIAGMRCINITYVLHGACGQSGTTVDSFQVAFVRAADGAVSHPLSFEVTVTNSMSHRHAIPSWVLFIGSMCVACGVTAAATVLLLRRRHPQFERLDLAPENDVDEGSDAESMKSVDTEAA